MTWEPKPGLVVLEKEFQPPRKINELHWRTGCLCDRKYGKLALGCGMIHWRTLTCRTQSFHYQLPERFRSRYPLLHRLEDLFTAAVVRLREDIYRRKERRGRP